jgi:hypothetical protein
MSSQPPPIRLLWQRFGKIRNKIVFWNLQGATPLKLRVLEDHSFVVKEQPQGPEQVLSFTTYCALLRTLSTRFYWLCLVVCGCSLISR